MVVWYQRNTSINIMEPLCKCLRGAVLSRRIQTLARVTLPLSACAKESLRTIMVVHRQLDNLPKECHIRGSLRTTEWISEVRATTTHSNSKWMAANIDQIARLPCIWAATVPPMDIKLPLCMQVVNCKRQR